MELIVRSVLYIARSYKLSKDICLFVCLSVRLSLALCYCVKMATWLIVIGDNRAYYVYSSDGSKVLSRALRPTGRR